nr:molybdate ABC transporter substrate-binding protein [uncultured Desulfuromonas sp.]
MRSFLFAIILSLMLVSTSMAGTINISVAASMTDAVKDLISLFEKEYPETKILPNFASSGALAKQIAQGAPAEIYISANPKWMKYLVDNNLINASAVRTFAHNTLVFTGIPEKTIREMKDLLGLKTLAIGSPKSVPAGQYAQQALEAAGLYEELQSRLVLAKDVRQALLYADRGEVDGAFVYKTDALLAQHAKILLEVPQHFYNEVTYPIALTLSGEKNAEAAAFASFLSTDTAIAVLEKYGFVIR